MASPVAKIIQCLEDEAQALTRSPQILSQSPGNITRYLELIAIDGRAIQGNVPKKRSHEILSVVKQYSTEFFVLCALATNQQILGTVKWSRNEILELCGWWDQFEKPMDILRGFWEDATRDTPWQQRQSIEIPGAWFIDVLKGREDTSFVLSWGGNEPPSIQLNDDIQQALAIMARMRGIIRS